MAGERQVLDLGGPPIQLWNRTGTATFVGLLIVVEVVAFAVLILALASPRSELASFALLLALAIVVAAGILTALWPRHSIRFETVGAMSVALGGAEVWSDTSAPRNRHAFAQLASDPQFAVDPALMRFTYYYAITAEGMTFWAWNYRQLVRFASLPKQTLNVVGRPWDTPNVILAVTTASGSIEVLALSPRSGRLGRGVKDLETASARIRSWLGRSG